MFFSLFVDLCLFCIAAHNPWSFFTTSKASPFLRFSYIVLPILFHYNQVREVYSGEKSRGDRILGQNGKYILLYLSCPDGWSRWSLGKAVFGQFLQNNAALLFRSLHCVDFTAVPSPFFSFCSHFFPLFFCRWRYGTCVRLTLSRPCHWANVCIAWTPADKYWWGTVFLILLLAWICGFSSVIQCWTVCTV